MAARAKKVGRTGKKAAGGRKAPTRKKAASKRKAAGKRTARKTTRKKTAKRGVAGMPDFPKSLDQFSRQMRKNLGTLEKQINRAGKEYRRGGVKLLREVSHQLGHFEALGERRWNKLTNNARSDVAKLLRRLEKVVQPPAAKKKRRRAR